MEEPERVGQARPDKMADDLVQKQGADRAVEIAIENISEAKAAQDNYSLSIWREVRALLRSRHKARREREGG